MPTATQAAAKLFLRRRQNKDAARLGHFGTDLLCALPVDIQEDVNAGRQYLLDGRAGRAVIVAEHFCVLKKCILLNHPAEFVFGDEKVVLAVIFTRAAIARGV
ncbi:hypothetical protein D3C76_1529910 [compost metagenome]